MKILYFLVLIPSLSFAQSKISFNAGGTFQGTSDGGDAGVTAAIGYKLTRALSVGFTGDGFVFDAAKYGVVRADVIIYPHEKSKTESSLFIALSPGWTIYSKYGATGNFAGDALVGGRGMFGKFAVYAGLGYGMSSIKVNDDTFTSGGFKIRLAFGI